MAMSKDQEKIVQIAREVVGQFDASDIDVVLIWGSVIEKDFKLKDKTDLDLLVIKHTLDLIPDAHTELIFGVPTKIFYRRGVKIDVFFVDYAYVKKAIEQKHWTIINAIINGMVIVDRGMMDKLKAMCSNFRAFSLSTSREWFNQANNLFEKAQSLLDEGEYLSSMVLTRHAVDAMAHALIYATFGKPASPKSFLADLRERVASSYLYDLYLESQGLRDCTRSDALKVNLLASEFLGYAARQLGRFRDMRHGNRSSATEG